MFPILPCFKLKSTDTGDDSDDSTDLSDDCSDMEDDTPAVTDILPISSDEEAELESQRIDISDLFRKTLPQKVHGVISTHSNGSAASVVEVTKKEQQTKQDKKKPVDTGLLKNKVFSIKFKCTTGKRKKTIPQKIEEHKSKKIVLENKDSGSLENSAALKVHTNTEGNVSLQVVEPTKKRTSSKLCKSTAKLNSSIICGIIYASSETHIIKFQCKKCRKLMYDIDNFSKHLHKVHGMLSLDEFSSDLKSIVDTASIKELRPDKNLLFKQCGKVELIDGKKLCFACTLCNEFNYIDLKLLHSHLKERHTYSVTDGSDLTHLQRVGVKGEVFIIKHLKKAVDKAKEDNCTEMEVSTSLPTLISSENKDVLAEDFSEVSSLPIPAPDTPPPESDDLIKHNVTNIPIDQNDKIKTTTQRKTKKPTTRKPINLKQNETAITSSKKSGKIIVKKPISMKPIKLSLTEMFKPTKLKTKLTATIKPNLKQTTLFDIVSFTKMDTIPTNNTKEQTIADKNLPKNVLISKVVEKTTSPSVLPKDLMQQSQALTIDDKINVCMSSDVHNDLKQNSSAAPIDNDMSVPKNLTQEPLVLYVDKRMNKFTQPDPSNNLTKQASVMAVNKKMINLLPHKSKDLKRIPTALPIDNKIDVELTKKELVVHAANEVDKFVLPVPSNILTQQRSVLPNDLEQKSPALPVDNKVDVQNNLTQKSSELHADNKMDVIILPDPSNNLTQKPSISVVNNETNIDILSHLTKDFLQQKSSDLPVDNKVDVNMQLNVSNNLMPKSLGNLILPVSCNDLTQKPPVSFLPKDSKQIPPTLLEDKKIHLTMDDKIVADTESHLSNNKMQKPPSPPESVKNFEQILYVIAELNENSSKSQLGTNKEKKPIKKNYKKCNTIEPPTKSMDQNEEITTPEKKTYNKKATNDIPLTCEICSRTFKKNSRLAEHKRLHTGEKPYACDICGKSFRIKRRLTEHKMRHRKEKTFKCEKCELAFVLKQDYTLHMRHHTGDRRHQCTMCSKAFVRSVDLTIHKRVHTGEKPFACEICGRTFRANQNLFVHRRSHLGEKNFKCEHCDKTFLRNIDRKVHMRTHTGEKPFKCEICGRGYSSRVHVRSHIEREHMGNENKNKSSTRKPYVKKSKKVIEQNKVLEDNDKKLKKTRSSSKPTQLNTTVVRMDNSEDNENFQKMQSMLKKEQKDLSINCFKSQVSVTLSMQVEKLPVLAVPKNENDSSILRNGNATPSALARK